MNIFLSDISQFCSNSSNKRGKSEGEKYRITYLTINYSLRGYFRYFSIAALKAKTFSQGTFKIL